jgi:hypothetical protein
MAAIGREARVIVGGKDWKTPRELRQNSRLPAFLKFIIRLLWEETSRYYMIQAWEDLYK